MQYFTLRHQTARKRLPAGTRVQFVDEQPTNDQWKYAVVWVSESRSGTPGTRPQIVGPFATTAREYVFHRTRIGRGPDRVTEVMYQRALSAKQIQ